jgi:RNA polymerase sigma-70 factor, ECF subfamily
MPASQPPRTEVTSLLAAWNSGDQQALQQLVPMVYDELRQAARRHMAGERPSHTLQTTALIHEVYVRLAGMQSTSIGNRGHFLALCAKLMRNVLVDFARSRNYDKRGGGAPHVELDEALHVAIARDPDLIAIDDALQRLAAVDARKANVVEMRFFGGFSVDETAAALDVSPETVMRDWKFAKSWLLRELRAESSRG